MQIRIGYVDGLRALAVLGVVVYHAYALATPALPGLTTQFFNLGAHGVDLFFVISGFCLAYPYLVQLRSKGHIDFHGYEFAAKRILRIVPPYYAAIVLCVLAAWLGFLPSVPRVDLVRQALFVDWQTQFINISFWTLAVEWRWYFYFAPALFLYAWRPWSLAAIGIALYAAYCVLTIQIVDLFVAGSFFLGIFAADMHLRGSSLQRYALPVLMAALVAGVLTQPAQIGNFPSTSLQLGMFALVVLAGSGGRLTALLSRGSLRWIGERSYSIYLMHYPAIRILTRYAHVPWPLAAVAGVGAGILFWFAVERMVTRKPVRDAFVHGFVGFAENVANSLHREKALGVVGGAPDQLVEPGIE